MKVVTIFLALLGLTQTASATWLAPEEIRTDLKPVSPLLSNTTEEEFRRVIRELQAIYAPIATMHGGKLSISGEWKSETLNAGAAQMFGNWQVKITGGLARRPELTTDAFTLILCHELGHHFGGFAIGPAQNPMEKPWAANEGQADYFATQVCAKKIWGGDQAKNAEFRRNVSPKIQSRCDPVWENREDQDLCYRVLTAVESLTATMAVLMKKPIPDLDTPDVSVVEKTSHKHPQPQCRMDTAKEGALCLSLFNDSVIPGKKSPGGIEGIEAEKDAAKYSCTTYMNHSVGVRPACWFKSRL